MHEHAESDPAQRLNWNLLIEFCGTRIVLEEEALVHPIESREEETCNWVQNWQAGRVHKHDTEVSVELCVKVMAGDVVTCVQGIQVRLQKQLRIYINFTLLGWLP